jgi:translation initiation factor 4A
VLIKVYKKLLFKYINMSELSNKKSDIPSDVHAQKDEDNSPREESESINQTDIEQIDESKKQRVCNKFENMNLKKSLLRGLFAFGFEKPSNIQALGILPIIKGGDIIAQSQSGTGKTGTFVIATLQKIDESVYGVQTIIISPTRELAQQIADVCINIGQYTSIKCVLCIGGTRIQECRRELERGPVIVIGTPGRIIDMIERRYLLTKCVKMLILDEADEMLSSSFAKEIKSIIEFIPESSQICLFSATMPREVLDITRKFMNNPRVILVKQEELTLEGIKQYYVDAENEQWKFDVLCDIYGAISISQSIVYVNTINKAKWLMKKLKENKFTVSIMHSNMKPHEREFIMKEFRSGITRILISTDLLSRGIDIQQVSIVLNYDIPNNKECYIHRIGRSGRYGRKGVAINFTTRNDSWKIDELKKFYETDINPLPEDFQSHII